MNVLVINCGSSSLKFQLINSESEQVLAKGLCERIGIDGQTYLSAGRRRERTISDKAMPTHTEAIQFVIDALTDERDRSSKKPERDWCSWTSCRTWRREVCKLCCHHR